MNEDPMAYKYQNAPGSGSTEFDHSMPDLSRFDRPLSPEPTAAQIKIEALRAAAAIMASHSDEFGNNGHHVGEATKDLAEQFRAWLSES